jgi:hypothetical protein
MKPILLSIGFNKGIFFIPSIRYTWEDCKCWSYSFVWGNFSIDLWTTCSDKFKDDLAGE